MPRSLWTGSISFGLVTIPVKIYTAVHDSRLDLDMLDGHDLSNIKFKRVNENTGREVNYNDIVKGYLYHDKYVVLEEEDFKSADAEKTKTIDIQNFTNESEIDPIYFEQPFYLEAGAPGMKAYGILRDALRETGRVGVATFVLRNKESLVIVKPYKNILALNRIRFEEEIRDTKGIEAPASLKGKNKELTLAIKLIDELTEKFDISKYRDTYTSKLLDIIKAKSRGKKVAHPKLKVVHKKTEDLMSALEASLGKKKRAS